MVCIHTMPNNFSFVKKEILDMFTESDEFEFTLAETVKAFLFKWFDPGKEIVMVTDCDQMYPGYSKSCGAEGE